MLSLALSITMGFQQPLLTFKSNFEPIGTVVEKLSAETKTPMLALGELKNYPIYINVKDVSFQDLISKIAQVTGAEWEQKDGGWYLTASQTLRTLQQRQGDPDVTNAIAATINAPLPEKKTKKDFELLGKDVEKNPEKMGEIVSMVFGNMMGADETTLRLLRSIGAKDLSSIVDGRRVVLSNRPNMMQGQMPSKSINEISSIIRQLAKEAITAGKKAPAKEKAGEEFDFDMSTMFGGGGNIQNPELANQIGIIQASFQIMSRSTLSVGLDVYASGGQPLYKKVVQLTIANPEEANPKVKGTSDIGVTNAAREYAQALMDGEKIDPMIKMITSGAGNFGVVVGGMMQPQAQEPESAPLSPAMKEIMSNPLKNEPMARLFGPILDLQSQKGNNVVALPSDDVFKTLTRALVAQNVTVEGVLDAVDRTISQEVSQDGTWTIVRASSPLELRSAFCNRTALTNLIKRGSAKGYLNLDDCAEFATAQGTARGSESLALPLVTAVFRTSDLGSASALTSNGFDGLKLYASLSDFQKQALRKKQAVPFASFTPGQKDLLSQMVFNGMMPPFKSSGESEGEMENFMGNSEDGDGEAADGMAAMGMAMAGPMMSLFGMGTSSLDDERTNLLPSGVPVVGSVKMNSMKMDSIMATNSRNGSSTITMPEMIGMMDSEIPFMKSMKRDYDTYRLAKQNTLFLFFKLGNKATYFTSLYDVEVDMSKTYTKEQLPQKLRDRMKPMEMPKISDGKPINP